MHQKMLITSCLALLLFFSTTIHAHNITLILSNHPDFSTFNHYLTTTHLASEINIRRTITVCVVSNSAMSSLISQNHTLPTLKNILSLHVFADYFGTKQLHHITNGSTTTSTLFQASGDATETTGYVNITNTKGGSVGFSPIDTPIDQQPMATFVKSIKEAPYNISVIQISNILTSPEAEAPTASPENVDLTSLMSNQGCKSFAALINAQPGLEDTFSKNVLAEGLTVFCPSDAALKKFMPRYNNLTKNEKVSVLLYHGMPTYNSLGMLGASKGLWTTLAADKKSKKFEYTVGYEGEDLKIDTSVSKAKIEGTLMDEDPLAVYKIDGVLLPKEMFKAALQSGEEGVEAPGPDGEDDGLAADENGGGKVVAGVVSFGLVFGVLVFGF